MTAGPLIASAHAGVDVGGIFRCSQVASSLLPAGTGSLARGLPPAPQGTLFALGERGSISVSAAARFTRTEPGREHLLEVRIAGSSPKLSTACHDQTTQSPAIWELSERERLVLVVLGQRYLPHEAHPAPLSWSQVAEQLAELQPQVGWTAKSAEHVVGAVRRRLARREVRGLTRDEVGEPVGNALNHNLLLELLLSTTLVPPDLRLVD
jgi:hypothetical protein